GGDVKLKAWTSASAYLLVQGEVLHLARDEASWVGSAYELSTTKADGGYLFADYNWKQRYNAGGSFEHYDDPANPGASVSSIGLFTGLALMEETTAFRLDWRRTDRTAGTPTFAPGGSLPSTVPVNELTLRVIFSMGPHKAHQF